MRGKNDRDQKKKETGSPPASVTTAAGADSASCCSGQKRLYPGRETTPRKKEEVGAGPSIRADGRPLASRRGQNDRWTPAKKGMREQSAQRDRRTGREKKRLLLRRLKEGTTLLTYCKTTFYLVERSLRVGAERQRRLLCAPKKGSALEEGKFTAFFGGEGKSLTPTGRKREGPPL